MKRFPIHFLHSCTFLEKCYFCCICLSRGKVYSSQAHQTAEFVAVVDKRDWDPTHPYIPSNSAVFVFLPCNFFGFVKGCFNPCDIVDDSAVN